MDRINISSKNPWEKKVGYSRAVITGDVIEVSGTTSIENGQIVGANDPYRQTVCILNRIKALLEENGFRMKDVIRTRMFVTDIEKWEEIGRAHAEFFSDVKPAATMVEVRSLIHADLLVEIEITARKTGLTADQQKT